MMAVRVQCPFCTKALRFRQPPTSGRRLLCTGCNRSFPVQPGMIEPIETRPAIPPAPVPAPARTPVPMPLPAAVLTPVAPPLPRPAAEAEPPMTAARRNMILAGVAVGLVFLVGTTALALALASRHDRARTREPIADRTPTNPDPAPNSDQTARSHSQTDLGNDREQQPPPPPRRDDDPVPVPRPRERDDIARPRIDAPKTTERSHLPRELQDDVNKAIDRGVAYLKKQQLPNGSWQSNNATGLAALPGLTLLECGVPADDPAVQKAAKFIRETAPKHNNRSTTYELSLSLLFLDRLGEARDKPLIRAIAMRLVAGQLPEGGWSYSLPLLPEDDEKKLAGFLDRTRLPGLDRFVQDRRPDDRKLDFPVRRPGDRGLDFPDSPGSKPGDPAPGGSTKSIEGGNKPGAKAELKPLDKDEAKKELDKLPPRLRNVPAAGEAAGKVPPNNLFVNGQADNSNTQFATLAMWAARRHGLPVERAIDLLARRFRNSQSPDGTWRYMTHRHSHFTPAMTGCGLLGLAVGHGVAADPTKTSTVKDERIDKGLKALGGHVGKPLGADPQMKKGKGKGKGKVALPQPRSPINLYFLWTVERVGVLYQVRELDGKDWYLWGVELLLPTQADEGSWHQPGAYHGATRGIDTCFALLFLKRANLASDLTKRLDFMVDGKPGR